MLEVLSERGLSLAVKEFVDKDYTRAIDVIIQNQMEKTIDYLVKKGVTEDNFEDELEAFITLRNAKTNEQETLEVRGNKVLRLYTAIVNSCITHGFFCFRRCKCSRI